MKDIRKIWDPNDPAFNLRIAATSLVAIGVIIMLAALSFAYRVSAANLDTPTAPTVSEPLPTVTERPAATEAVPSEEEAPNAEVIALQESLAAAQAELETLRTQLSDATTNADQLQEELDALRQDQETLYVLLFRLERSATFPGTAESITFTQTVDPETYELWEPGEIITDYDDFLTLPDDSLFHDWTVVLADKYIINNAA